jgi:hypothetical protein
MNLLIIADDELLGGNHPLSSVVTDIEPLWFLDDTDD